MIFLHCRKIKQLGIEKLSKRVFFSIHILLFLKKLNYHVKYFMTLLIAFTFIYFININIFYSINNYCLL